MLSYRLLSSTLTSFIFKVDYPQMLALKNFAAFGLVALVFTVNAAPAELVTRAEVCAFKLVHVCLN